MRNLMRRIAHLYAQMVRRHVAHIHDIDFGPFRTTDRTIWRLRAPSFAPKYRLTRRVHDALDAVARADQDLQRFTADDALAYRMMREALTRNAYGTASIEGNPLTLQDVESLLAASPTPDRVAMPDEREILNYAAFVRRLDATPVPRTTADVLALHATLFEGVIEGRGQLKARPNFIGRRETREVIYVATPPEHVEAELDAALAWLHEAEEHPLVKAIVFFHEFQSIHPFADGNGRLGRALTTLLLWQAGYRGVRYAFVDFAFNEDRDAYYARLDDARRGEWDLTPWLEYMALVLRRTFEGAVQRFLFRDGLPENLNERQARVAEWFARIDQENRGRRVKFNDVHAAFPQVPRRTLQLDLATLSERGVLHREGERKGTTYAFAG
jgi:Fic family protein